MPPKKSKRRDKDKKYRLEFTFSSAFFWCLGLFLLLGWIFVLGILVGRGFLPGEVKTIQEMRAQIAKLQEMINREDSSDLERIKGLQKDPKFEFYDELSTKKEAATQKGKSPPAEAPAGSEPDEGASSAERSERFTLQVASLEREVDAIKMVNRLVERKYPAYYYRARVNERTYFRVRCGSFKTREEADAFGRLLAEKESIKGFVTQAEK